MVETTCSACHSLTNITNAGHSRADWDTVVHMMVNTGAKLSSNQIPMVVDYLVKNFPEKPLPPANIIPGSVKIAIREWE